MNLRSAVLATAMLFATAPSSAATVPTVVPVGTPPARMVLLRPAVRRYLRYSIKDGVRSTSDIWTRTISYEPQDGVRRLHITQEWDRVVPPVSVAKQDAWFDPATFAPLTHVRILQRDGNTSIGGYRFAPGAIVGMAELPNNGRKDFRAAAPEPAFNFEYDMELLQTLPWRRGYVADIVFYDPGLEPPAHYLFRQAGEAMLATPGGSVDCWIVTADYNTGHVVNRFWIDKRTQLVLHEQGEQDGTVYVKTMLADEQPAEAAAH